MFKRTICDAVSFVTRCIIFLKLAIRRWVHYGHKGMDLASNNTLEGIQYSVTFKQCSTGIKGPKVCPENILHSITPEAWIMDTRQDGSMFTTNPDPTIWMFAAEIRTHQIKQRFSRAVFYSVVHLIYSSACSACISNQCAYSPSTSARLFSEDRHCFQILKLGLNFSTLSSPHLDPWMQLSCWHCNYCNYTGFWKKYL